MKILVPALVAAAAVAAFAPAGTPSPEVTLAYDKDVYLPGEAAYLTVTGAPGTIVWLGFDFDHGPTTLPGFGTFDLGFSSTFKYAQLPPLPASGEATYKWQCNSPCTNPISLNDLYTQGVALDPVTLEFSVTNSDVLNVEDLYGFCGSEGCEPCDWKSNTWKWWKAGIDKYDSFGKKFGLEDCHDLSMYKALGDCDGCDKGWDGDWSCGCDIDPSFAAAAAAALLNAKHPDVDYALTADEVRAMVKDAYQSGSWQQMQDVRDVLAHLNQAGCPF